MNNVSFVNTTVTVNRHNTTSTKIALLNFKILIVFFAIWWKLSYTDHNQETVSIL